MRKLLCFILTLIIISSCFTINAYASEWDDNITVTYKGKTLPLKEYNPGTGKIYFSKDGKACTYHKGSSCSNCKTFSDSQTSAKQCLGFAFYVQKSLFGCYYWNYNKSNIDKFDVIYHLNKDSNNKQQNIKKTFENVKFGAHIRAGSHSMIFLKSDANYIWTYEANVDYQCRVRIKKRTWDEMYEYINGRGLKYISSPKETLFSNTNSETKKTETPKEEKQETKTEVKKEEKKECLWHISYNDKGYCKSCGKEYSINISSMSSTTYEAVKNDVPVRKRPYSPESIIKYLSKGTKVTVVASGKNSKGNLWYKLNDGTWIYSENLKKSTSSSTQSSQSSAPKQPTNNTSIRFELESVPKGNLPYGKSFSLKGWFRSDSPIVEARAYILDENKSVVMQSETGSSTTKNYKIQGYKLDKTTKFSKLAPGAYYLKYYVRDANGDTATWISDKFYIVK